MARKLPDQHDDRYQAAVRHAQQADLRYQSIVRSLPMGMHVYELDDQNRLILVDANPAADRITGIKTSELFGKTIEEAFPPLKSSGIPSRYRLAADKGVSWQTVELEYEDDRIKGAFDVYAFQTGPRRMAALFLDITARKHAELALRRSEERLRAVFEGATNVAFIITDARDPEPNILEFSPGAENLFGRERGEVLNKGIGIIHRAEDVGFYPSIHRRLRDGMTGYSGEMTLVRKGGEPFPALLRLHPLLDDRGQMYAALCVAVDISEQRRLESFLQQAQKMEAIGALASGIAHDFNNILGAIIGHAELAQLGVAPDSPIAANLDQVLGAAGRARDLVSQILAFSRRSNFALQPLELSPLVQEAVKLLRASIPSTIDIRSHLANDDEGCVLANSTQIHQVLVNLCTNAAHAMPSGGALDVTVESCTLDEESARTVRGAHPGAYVRLSVADTGHGIEPLTLPKIFDPYFTTKDKGVGTGLGLAVVQGIVEGCGGAIRVTSQVGAGATFDVYFPRLGVPATDRIEHYTPPPRGHERILVVDDEPALLKAVGRMLESLGYDVLTYSDAVEALNVFSERPEYFDLVVTDQTMPSMTGDAFAREVLRLRPDTRIVLCTGYSEHISEVSARRMGIRRFLMKPLVMRTLADTVRQVLDSG